MTHSPDHAERANDVRPIWAVAIHGFADCYVEADTKASARWCAASACHEAGYGRSPVDLISRGCSVHPSTRFEADLFATRTLIAPRSARAALHDAKEAGEQGCGEGRDG